MGLEARLKLWLRGLNPWMPMFSFVALFQFIRGAQFDALYFAFIVVVLAIDWKQLFPFEFPGKPKPNLLILTIGSAVFGVAISLAPRKSPIEVALMVSALFVAISLVWYKDSGPLPKLTPALIKSKWVWICFAILVSLWELFAFILSDIAGDPYAYPTISIVISPVMADGLGRAIFLTVWLLIGVVLLRIERKR